MARVLVGTSGYSYRHWRGILYGPGVPQRLWLEAYAGLFTAVELNVTFYRMPDAETFEGWRDRTPPGFAYVLKGPQTITHYRRLLGTGDSLALFAERSAVLGGKLECVLWQLSPKMPADEARLGGFAEALHGAMPGVRHAFEFRHPSWFSRPVYRLLREQGFALVTAHAPWREPVEEATAPFAYLRMHAGAERADGCYTERELAHWSGRVAAWTAGGRDVYAFFNNDPHGCAVRDGVRFAELTHAPLASGAGSLPIGADAVAGERSGR